MKTVGAHKEDAFWVKTKTEAVNLWDISFLEKQPGIKQHFDSFMVQKYKQLGDREAVKYFNTNPEFRNLLQTVRQGTIGIKDIIWFLDNDTPVIASIQGCITMLNGWRGYGWNRIDMYERLLSYIEDAKSKSLNVEQYEKELPRLEEKLPKGREKRIAISSPERWMIKSPKAKEAFQFLLDNGVEFRLRADKMLHVFKGGKSARIYLGRPEMEWMYLKDWVVYIGPDDENPWYESRYTTISVE